MKADANRLVIDASVTLAWCFEEEKTPFTKGILDRMAEGAEAAVPAIWPLEIANALLTAERHKRLAPSQSSVFLDQLEHFNISVESLTLSRAFTRILDEARQWHLSSYDASYLELALRQGLPLATLDQNLKKAAKSLGVSTFHG